MHSFGEVLQSLRISKSFTQADLASLANCSTRTIMRIENNQINIAPHLLYTLSNIFNLDLNQYNNIILDYGSYENYILCKKTRTIIITRDFNQLPFIIDEFVINDNSTETFKLWFNYASVVKSLYIDNDKSTALKLLLHSFSLITVPDFLTFEIDNIYSDPYTSLLILSCGVLDMNGYISQSNHLTKLLFDTFKNNIFSEDKTLNQYDFDFRRKYITIINNYAHVCFENDDIETALYLVNFGIEKCIEFQTLHSIEYLYCLQCQALYILKDYELCKESLNFFNMFCKLKNNSSLYKKIISKYNFTFD